MFDVFRRTLTVLKDIQGEYNEDGIWERPKPETLKDELSHIQASVQGANNEVLDTLPEGYRTSTVYVLYTDSKLSTSKTNTTTPDLVVIDDEYYQVVKVTPQNNLPNYHTNHYEIVVVKQNVDDIEKY
jgi:hypothetical protein